MPQLVVLALAPLSAAASVAAREGPLVLVAVGYCAKQADVQWHGYRRHNEYPGTRQEPGLVCPSPEFEQGHGREQEKRRHTRHKSPDTGEESGKHPKNGQYRYQ